MAAVDRITPLRWVLTPLATLAAFALSLAALAAASTAVAPMVVGLDLEAVLPMDYRVACVGGTVAFTTMVAGSKTAPSARRVVSILIFAVGSWAAWFLLRSWSFPESHPRAYQMSLVPLIGTEIGGLLGVGLIGLQAVQQRAAHTDSA